MPWAVKQQCLWIVRDYERNRRNWLRLRREILDAGGDHSTTYTVNGEERRAIMPTAHAARRTTEDKQMQLEALEHTQAFRQMRAVEHAKARVGADLPEMIRDALQDAIMLNCQNGRRYPFEQLFVVGISRTEFYRQRDAFFRWIADELGLWW